MPQELLGRDAEVVVFLEAMVEEVFDDGRCAFRNGRTVVLDDAVEGWHWFEKVIGGPTFEQFNNGTANAPRLTKMM